MKPKGVPKWNEKTELLPHWTKLDQIDNILTYNILLLRLIILLLR